MDYNKEMAVRVSALLDIVFKYIFGSPESGPILTGLINAVQKDSGFPEVESVEIENPFNDKTYQDDKLSIIDVRARAVSGEWYNIEVQLQSQYNFPERSLYYWANAYARQLTEGKEYKNLNKVISINFVNFVLLDENIPFHSCFLIREKDYPECVLTEDLIIHYLEIPKMEEMGLFSPPRGGGG
jgi:predicted transposase/invertase (TIGR01784 family)